MRRYLAWMIGTAAALLAAVAAVNWAIDPFAIYGAPAVEGLNAVKPGIASRQRLFKSVTVARGAWEALIVGTSRAEIGLDPGHPFFAGRRCFNAATGGQTVEESARLVEAALQGGALRQVLVAVDFPVFNAHVAAAPDFTERNYAPWRRAETLVGIDTLALSLRTALHQEERPMRERVGLWRADGRFVPPPVADARLHTLKSERDYLEKHLYPAPAQAFAFRAGEREPLAALRRLLAAAREARVELTLVILPAHARHQEAIAAAGLWPAFEHWKRELARLNEEEARRRGAAAFALWDFTGYGGVAAEPFPRRGERTRAPRWYWDSSHFYKEAGDAMLDRMMAPPARSTAGALHGARLDSAGIEGHLASLRAARAAWRERNPEDVAEIEAMAAQAARTRP